MKISYKNAKISADFQINLAEYLSPNFTSIKKFGAKIWCKFTDNYTSYNKISLFCSIFITFSSKFQDLEKLKKFQDKLVQWATKCHLRAKFQPPSSYGDQVSLYLYGRTDGRTAGRTAGPGKCISGFLQLHAKPTKNPACI